MEEYTTDAFANRDEPLPLLTVTRDDDDLTSSESEAEADISEHGRTLTAAGKGGDGQSPSARSQPASIQDRLFSKLLAQVIPAEGYDDSEDEKTDRKSSNDASRPPFSLPVMTNNFRRFNARIGIVFVFQNRMIRLLGWRTTTHTLSFLAVYTFVCLNPYLLIVLPLTIALFAIMVPAFISRHPPPPRPTMASSSLAAKYHPESTSFAGPALAPPRTIKPAAETSKDFFRNMRDLQNSMADFSNMHDILVQAIAPVTNFSDEVLSTRIFLLLTFSTTVLFIAAQLIPFRFVFLLGGHATIISGHPTVKLWLSKQQKKTQRQLAKSEPNTPREAYGLPLPSPQTTFAINSALASLSEINLTTTPETREVEIFELQYRPLIPIGYSSSLNPTHDTVYEWQSHVFTSVPYDPLSPARIAGNRPQGTRFLEDVQPPPGWGWESKKWELDLEAGEWVNDRLIVGVEFDVTKVAAAGSSNSDEDRDSRDHERDGKTRREKSTADPVEFGEEANETFEQRRQRQMSINFDFGGWVWDLAPSPGTSGDRDEDVWLAYGDYDLSELTSERERRKKEKARKEKVREKEKGHSHHQQHASQSSASNRDWEEVTVYGNQRRTGEWRRRRWVRVVKRLPVEHRQL